MARIDVLMPSMGESLTEGTLTKWFKKVGDAVKRDETIFEISTDKVDSEVQAVSAGVLAEILVKEGETVPVNAVVARLETDATLRPSAEPPRRRPAKRAEPVAAARADGWQVSGERTIGDSRARRRLTAGLRRRACRPASRVRSRNGFARSPRHSCAAWRRNMASTSRH